MTVPRLLLSLALASAACSNEGAGPPAAPPPPVVATKLPTLRVETAGATPITSKDAYLPGTFVLRDTLDVVRQQGALEVRGHGNSTWALFPKKPYRLKLGTSSAMLDMPANRHWVLLANYSDKTLVRNETVFDLSRRMGFAWTPRSEDVDLYVNGAYAGIYQLTEHVRVAPERVNVPELKAADTSAAVITGGYLMEFDETRDEAFCLTPGRTSTVICVKNPESLLDKGWEKQRAYIEGYLRALDSTLYSPDFANPTTGYAAYLDVGSVVDFYLLNELVKNVDGNLRRSDFMYKPRGGKIVFGPVWDFDLAIGNVNYLGADLPYGWYVRSAPWFARLFEDPAFEARVKARWKQLRDDGTIGAAFSFSSQRTTFLGQVQAANFATWPILNTWVWPNRVVAGTYQGEVRAMQDWLRQRIQWMDEQLR